MTTFNTNTDLNARGRRLAETCKQAEASCRRLHDRLPAFFARRPVDPAETLARAERREAARRAVDTLLR